MMISINKSIKIDIVPNESLLETLERNGHTIEYQCREGYCGACKVTKEEGEVDYFEDPIAAISEDEILPCCCTPKTALSIRL